jgi:hypothetical protein
VRVDRGGHGSFPRGPLRQTRLIALAGPFRVIGGELVTRDDFDVGFRVDSVPADADLGVPAVGDIDGNGIDLEPVAAVVGDDGHAVRSVLGRMVFRMQFAAVWAADREEPAGICFS